MLRHYTRALRPSVVSRFTRRPFHSQFAVLSSSESSSSSSHTAHSYEKHHDSTPDPAVSHSGKRTYTVNDAEERIQAQRASPLQTPIESSDSEKETHYEKHHDVVHDPTVSHSGKRTYVVSQPDVAHTPYEVPSGAYHNSSPYTTGAPQSSPPPTRPGDEPSSSSNSAAHPYTTTRVQRNEDGVGESGAVRFRGAPGGMGDRGGGDGGLGLMDKKSTKAGPEGELVDRKPPPVKPKN